MQMYTVLCDWTEDGHNGSKLVATIKYVMCPSCDWQY